MTLASGETNSTIDFGFFRPTDYQITKHLNTPEPVGESDPVSFTIRIINTGPSWITELPLRDVYDPQYLRFESSSPFPTTVSSGQVNWSDLTVSFGRDLAPGDGFTVIVNFTGLKDTTENPFLPPDGRTENRGVVNGAKADPDGPTGPLPGTDPLPLREDAARVQILKKTGLKLGALTGVALPDSVLISWQTLSEVNILGFNLLRATDSGAHLPPEEAYTLVNPDPILATGAGADNGSAYAYHDQGAAPGESYIYQLQVLRLDGTSDLVGVVEVHPPQQWLFMPMLTRR